MARTPFMAMPKAAMDKDYDAPGREDDVRVPGKSFVMQTITKACSP